MSGVNLRKPNGLLKIAKLPSHKNNWKGNVDKAAVKYLRVEEKEFLRETKWTIGMAFLIYRWLYNFLKI